MECNNCKSENSNAYNYCENCGEKFPKHCRSCGAVTGIERNYCEQCGVPLAEKDKKKVEVETASFTPMKDGAKDEKTSQAFENTSTLDCGNSGVSAGTGKTAGVKNPRVDSKPKEALDTPPVKSQYKIDLSPFLTNRDDRCYVKGKIPEKQLANAIENFAPGVNLDEALVLADNSVRRNGKLGFILTTEAFYCKGDFVDPIKISLSDIHSISTKKGFINKYIVINGSETLHLGLISLETAECLVAAIRKAVLS